MFPDSVAICRFLCSSSSPSLPPVSDCWSRDHWSLSQSRAPWYTLIISPGEDWGRGRGSIVFDGRNSIEGGSSGEKENGWKSSRRNRADTFRLQKVEDLCLATYLLFNVINIGWMRSWATGYIFIKVVESLRRRFLTRLPLLLWTKMEWKWWHLSTSLQQLYLNVVACRPRLYRVKTNKVSVCVRENIGRFFSRASPQPAKSL